MVMKLLQRFRSLEVNRYSQTSGVSGQRWLFIPPPTFWFCWFRSRWIIILLTIFWAWFSIGISWMESWDFKCCIILCRPNLQLFLLKFEFLFTQSVLAYYPVSFLVLLCFFFFCWRCDLATHACRKFYTLVTNKFADTCILVMIFYHNTTNVYCIK